MQTFEEGLSFALDLRRWERSRLPEGIAFSLGKAQKFVAHREMFAKRVRHWLFVHYHSEGHDGRKNLPTSLTRFCSNQIMG